MQTLPQARNKYLVVQHSNEEALIQDLETGFI